MTNDKWLADLETGVFELDRENRSLVGLVDAVISASESGDLAGLREALIQLLNQSKIDFAREDGLMDALRYQGAAQHQSEHRQLLAEIEHQIDDLNGGQAYARHLLRFQKDWFIQHISSQDILLGEAIRTHKGICNRRHAHGPRMTEDELDAFEDRRQGILEPIVWTNKLNIGVAAIDAEHRALVAVCNSILDVNRSRDSAELAPLMEQLGDLTAAHFETEEKLMAQFGYAHAVEHRKEHLDLLQEYGHQVQDWRANRISANFLCRFMYRWLVQHIMTTDKRFFAVVPSQGDHSADSPGRNGP